jgi:DNA-binding transcriptional LysR family regulator
MSLAPLRNSSSTERTMTVNLPTNLLRSFVAIVDAGSMLSATEQVFVTQSALSLQIRRLEELVDRTLFTREGRRLVLTPAGEVLLEYSRRMLSLHDEAVLAVSARDFFGPVRVGMVQDFADTVLAGALARFHERHPNSRIFARVAGTAELLTMLERHQLDVVVGFDAVDAPRAVRTAPMVWYGDPALADEDVVPLAVLEKPCRFREAAIASLEAAGRRYRISVETPNLSTLRAAVQANLGIGCRTPLFAASVLVPIPAERLPPLPAVACTVTTAKNLDARTARLGELIAESVRSL